MHILVLWIKLYDDECWYCIDSLFMSIFALGYCADGYNQKHDLHCNCYGNAYGILHWTKIVFSIIFVSWDGFHVHLRGKDEIKQIEINYNVLLLIAIVIQILHCGFRKIVNCIFQIFVPNVLSWVGSLPQD